ncbi:MAG: hypothetical protein H0T46_20400 [Deltaproteobacteria bacterium]|nr:hypothetical protein [Deltaproteobacteria bacterium]
MSNATQDRGKLFEHAQKQKPSQPGFHGECTIDGRTYEIRGWIREEQLAISLAPPRGDKNTFPPDVFRGVLDPAPAKSARPGKRDQSSAETTPAWSGDIVSDDAAYRVRAFEKQGKSGVYFTLSFERIEKPAEDDASSWESPEA